MVYVMEPTVLSESELWCDRWLCSGGTWPWLMVLAVLWGITKLG